MGVDFREAGRKLRQSYRRMFSCCVAPDPADGFSDFIVVGMASLPKTARLRRSSFELAPGPELGRTNVAGENAEKGPDHNAYGHLAPAKLHTPEQAYHGSGGKTEEAQSRTEQQTGTGSTPPSTGWYQGSCVSTGTRCSVHGEGQPCSMGGEGALRHDSAHRRAISHVSGDAQGRAHSNHVFRFSEADAATVQGVPGSDGAEQVRRLSPVPPFHVAPRKEAQVSRVEVIREDGDSSGIRRCGSLETKPRGKAHGSLSENRWSAGVPEMRQGEGKGLQPHSLTGMGARTSVPLGLLLGAQGNGGPQDGKGFRSAGLSGGAPVACAHPGVKQMHPPASLGRHQSADTSFGSAYGGDKWQAQSGVSASDGGIRLHSGTHAPALGARTGFGSGNAHSTSLSVGNSNVTSSTSPHSRASTQAGAARLPVGSKGLPAILDMSKPLPPPPGWRAAP